MFRDVQNLIYMLADLVKLNDVRMIQHFQDFNLTENFLQISFIQFGLVNDLYRNLYERWHYNALFTVCFQRSMLITSSVGQ